MHEKLAKGTRMTTALPDPATSPELFEDLLKRRTAAYFVDLFIISVLVFVVLIIGLLLGLLTLGAAWIALPLAIPVSIVGYYAITLGSPRRATVGMRMMDVVLTPARGSPLEGWQAFLHPLLFWLTCWILPPFSFLVALFTPRRQLLHDLILGTLMVRRSPMERHWSEYAAS